tara:strand:- start:121 stop:681 length:561 start_codon:yes stop_codon:yes gene_type:complete
MDKIIKRFIGIASLITVIFGIGYFSGTLATKQKNILAKKEELQNSYIIKELTTPSPSLQQVEYLLNAYLNQKSKIYSVPKDEDLSEIIEDLSKIVNYPLIYKIIDEVKNDVDNNRKRIINIKISRIEFGLKNSSRIEVLVTLQYFEENLSTDGTPQSSIEMPELKNKYVLGYSNSSWKLIDFVNSN